MTTCDLIEYLKKYPSKSKISFLIVNSHKRVVHNIDGFGVISDMESPVFYVETINTSPLDEGSEQMSLYKAVNNHTK